MFKKLACLLTIAAMANLGVSNDLHAQGEGYVDGANCSYLSPEYAFGALLLVSGLVLGLLNHNSSTTHTSH